MKEIDLSFNIALRVWWSYTWRSVVIIFPTLFVIGAIAGMIIGGTGGVVEDYAILIQVVATILGSILSFVIFRDVLNKRYKTFRLVIVENEPEEEKPGIQPSI